MAFPVAPSSLADPVAMATRQILQACLSWRELVAAIRSDSRQLRWHAMHLRIQSRRARAQAASLLVQSVALCLPHAPPE